jgi:hypothetical protein
MFFPQNTLFLNITIIMQAFILFLMSLGMLCSPSNASTVTQQENDYKIEKIFKRINADPNKSMSARLNQASLYFLGKEYKLGALGEGSQGSYDQWPLYRFDAFDCDTYVNTIIALAISNTATGFKKCLNKLRYQNGDVDFVKRNHFTSLDWNINNQKQGFFKDITNTVKDEKNKSVAKMAQALIDKPSWYKHKSINIIRLSKQNKQDQEQQLEKLKKLGSRLPRTLASIPYVPLTALFDENKKPNLALFSQIPEGSIVEIVRPNWDLRKEIGTCLNVSHLGLVFWKNGLPLFRQASSNEGKVVEVSLIDYLKDSLTSPTIKGINIQVLVPIKPLSDDCR